MILEKPVQRLRPYTLKASKPSLALLQKPLGGSFVGCRFWGIYAIHSQAEVDFFGPATW